MNNKTIPMFPEFVPLSLDLRQSIEDLTNKFEPYSDFNFVSMFTWDIEEEIAVSMLNNNLVVRFTDYIDESLCFFSFIGETSVNETAETLLKHQEKGLLKELKLIPEFVAEKLNTSSFIVSEDRDNFDYILSVDDLVEFRSNKFRGKRNLLNRFHRFYGDKVKVELLDLAEKAVQKELLDLFTDWEAARQKKSAETKNEFEAIRRLAENIPDLPTFGVGVRYEGKLIGYSLLDMLPDQGCVLHYDKGNTEFVGIFEFLKNEVAKALQNKGITWINYEQDLGIEGLRRAKESCHPTKFLKKFTIRLKS